MSSLGFSYAQAAKGLAPSSNVSSNPGSSTSSDHGAKDATAAPEATTTQPKQIRNVTNLEKAATIQNSPQTSRQSEEVSAQREKLPTDAYEQHHS